MNAISDQEIQDILDQVVRDITNRIANIYLCKQEVVFSDDICTVHTTFEGGYHATLILCADTVLLTRLTQHIIQEETVAPQDIEDFTKEFFNVICGQIASKLFQTAHISSRFHIPDFHTGRYIPGEKNGSQYILSYTSNHNEGVQLIHQIPV